METINMIASFAFKDYREARQFWIGHNNAKGFNSKYCDECGVVGYLRTSEKNNFPNAKRKLKYFFNSDFSGKQFMYCYCQNRIACGRDKKRYWKEIY